MANLLTAIRLLLIFPFVFLMTRDDASFATIAGIIFVMAIVSDVVDGPVARRQGTVTERGRTADHIADFLLVTCGLMAGATRGAFPWILPILIVVAFVQYVVDSYWLHSQRQLRMSQLGRWNGILYFVPLGGDILIRLGLGFLEPLLLPVCWALAVSTVLSIGDRLAALHHKDTEGVTTKTPRH